VLNSVINWLDARLNIREGFKELLDEPLPEGVGWTHVFGSISLFLFILQAATGIFISMFYAPTPEAAHLSVSYIQNELFLGAFVRGLHHWGSSFFVVFTVVHLLRTFIYSAYKYPRELTWIFGVILFNLVLAFGLTGYLLPWDQKAYWATVVTLNIAGTAPLFGDVIQKILQGGEVIGAVTLTHFYSLHVIVLPLLTLGAVTVHVFLQKRQGITPPFKSPDEEVKFKSRFWPDQLFKDGVAILLIFLILSGFAIVFGAPLEKMADPTDTSYVPKPEWYFLSMYQLQKIFPGKFELIGTIIIPTIGILALMLLPFYDKNPSRKLKDRKLALTLMAAAMMTVGGLTILGATDDRPEDSTVIVEMPEGEGSSRLQPSELSGRYLYQNESCMKCHNIGGSHGEGEYDLLKTSGDKSVIWLKEHFSNPTLAQPEKIVEQVSLKLDQITDLKAFYLRLSTLQRDELLTVEEEVLYSANLYSQYKCGACHKIDDPEPGFGPNLTGVTLRHDRDYIYDHFLDPKKFDSNSIMPKFDWLPKEELNALTDFLYYIDK